MTQVPAATRTLSVLRVLAAAPGPMTAVAISRELSLPRSSTYHLLTAMAESGFVVHLPEAERWGLGVAAFEVGAAYSRQAPLRQLADPLLTSLVKLAQPISVVAHLGVLHGAETLYLAKQESRRRPPVVTEVGVRLPAALTATGRAMLAQLPMAEVRAQLPSDRPFIRRTGRGPKSWAELQRLLADEREAGYSFEDGFIKTGFATLAVPVLDHLQRPTAAMGLTFSAEVTISDRRRLVAGLQRTAQQLGRRLGGQ